MNSVLDILWLRRPSLNYVSPGVCEASFSGSGSPLIILDALARGLGPTGLVLGGTGGFRLSWNNYPGALCFSVYKAVDELQPFGAYVLIAECITDNFIDLDAFGSGVYRVTAITLEGESEPSEPITFAGAGFDTVFLTVDSDPAPGVPIELGPNDLDGNSDGTTAFSREYTIGRTINLTAPLTDNLLVFEKWQKDGVDFSEEQTVGLTLVADTEMKAFYVCDVLGGDPIPASFTLGSPTSLGFFAVKPDGVAVLISSSATAANYSFIYKGGAIQGGPLANLCFELYVLPPGFKVLYDNGVSQSDLSTSPTGSNCYIDQLLLEADVPIGKTDIVGHVGGSLSLQWTGPPSGVDDYVCADSCPRWEVIQDSGLITQPASMRIRDFNIVGPLIAPPALWNLGAVGCTDFSAANFPLETDPTQVEWDGTNTQGFNHFHSYAPTFYNDNLDTFELDTGERIALNGFEVSFSMSTVSTGFGGTNLAYLAANLSPLTDPIPPSVSGFYWVYAIFASNGMVFWAGVKPIGDSPVGQYQRIACACPVSAPECIYIEAGD